MPLPQFKPQEVEDPIEAERKKLEKITQNIPLRIGVHAGKGGVGKTFLATQIALYYASKGNKVGLIDADVDCPNVPDAIGIRQDMTVTESGKLNPVVFKNIKIVSSGFMQEPGTPLIIRGPIKHRLLTDFIEKSNWGELDVLVFDFPPGTSDVPLSAMQVANLTGLVIVSTSSKSALTDLKRAINMAKKLDTRIYGIVENMAGEIFGEGKVEEISKELEVNFLTSIPLDSQIRKKAEQGDLALSTTKFNEIIEKI